MSGIFKALLVGGAAVFVSEFVQGASFGESLPGEVKKYGGAALGAWAALNFIR